MMNKTRYKPTKLLVHLRYHLGSWLASRHKRTAHILNQRTAGIRTNGWKCILLVFCCLSGTTCIGIIHAAWQYPPAVAGDAVKPVIHLRHLGKSSDNHLHTTAVVPETIVSFRQYVDSLQRTRDGDKILDSIRLERPGLLDSLEQVEHLYEAPSSIPF